ncbi:hypothetical protein [Lishizhenia sp.]|uniref:hypothetical protein n=1 Tax=Lishizhenia sp. TaxID=2497594 RepID=UPI00299F0A3C|nr:hypothetical protein [Lishizhenia sp.]MDX1445785.1 hypothetical protein [Lishizhenia sp.]
MQETIENQATLVEKEVIPTLHFKHVAKHNVNKDLHEKLKEATTLGNLHHGKCAIIFEDEGGLKRVETTVWATGAKYICLKGGIWLPISCIREVRFL